MANSPNIVVRKRPDRHQAEDKKFLFSEEDILFSDSHSELSSFRMKAYEQYQKKSLPSTREEAWRRTDLRALHPERYSNRLTNNWKSAKIPKSLLDEKKVSTSGELILTPSGVENWLSEDLSLKGVIFCDLRTAVLQYPDLVQRVLGQVVPSDEDIFSAIAGAFAKDGVFLYVPTGIVVEKPFHSIFFDLQAGSVQVTNIIGIIEEGASVSYIHETNSSKGYEPDALNIGTTEFIVKNNANFAFYELQNWAESIWNFTHERICAENDSNVEWVIGALGSRLTKSFITLDLFGKGSKGKVSGVTFTTHHQHLDYDTQQNHLASNTNSDLLFKGGLKDESRTIWQGMIYVAPGADKADGYQMNRNLVLSSGARADSIPGLEILADDVRCSHGTSISNVDADQIFYLLSRGIPEAEAKRMIVEGFFDPVFHRIPFKSIRNRYKSYLNNKL